MALLYRQKIRAFGESEKEQSQRGYSEEQYILCEINFLLSYEGDRLLSTRGVVGETYISRLRRYICV